MTCSSCVNKVERHVRGLPGVKTVDIALLTHRGRVKYDASIIGPRDIITELCVININAYICSILIIFIHLESWLSYNSFI